MTRGLQVTAASQPLTRPRSCSLNVSSFSQPDQRRAGATSTLQPTTMLQSTAALRRFNLGKPLLLHARAASTQTRGLDAILKKKPDDVVITFARRTPMGRVKKGGGMLANFPVDELLKALFTVRDLCCP